jgi:multidrug efflux pump subunit AcrB
MDTIFFRQPRLVMLALLVILSAGMSALVSIGRQEDPTITNIFATITTVFPGADPARVEALVTAKIETELRTIPEIAEVASTSATGISVVSVELIETVPPETIEQIWSQVRDAVADARREFPAGVLEPEFDSDGAGGYAAIFALTLPEGFSLTRAAREAEALADRLRAVSGTKLVDLHGLPEEEVLVTLDPARAAALGLTADQVSAAIGAADAKVQAGRLRGEATDLVLGVTGEITSLDRLRGVVLREDAAGRVTLLGDVAQITRGPRLPLAEAALYQGQPAILVSAKLSEGLQVDRWMADIRAAVEAQAAALPWGLSVETVFDQSRYTTERLTEVGLNMALGVALVVAVLFVTLGWRSALIVAMVLPVVTLASVATLNALAVPIHQMSVTGLIVALGLLVDAAIVMTDEVGKRLRAGLTRLEAVAGSVRRLTMPLAASTVTTILSFMPLLLLPGPAGDFVGSIAISVIVMLAWSFVVAVTITPAIAGRWLRSGDGTSAREGVAMRGFRAVLTLSMANPLRTVALALVLPVLGFLSLPTLTPQFFPGVDRDQFHIEVDLPPGTGIDETLRVVREIDARLGAEEGILDVAWVTGRSAPAFYYNMVGDRDQAPAFAQALIRTASPAATARLLEELQADLPPAFPAGALRDPRPDTGPAGQRAGGTAAGGAGHRRAEAGGRRVARAARGGAAGRAGAHRDRRRVAQADAGGGRGARAASGARPRAGRAADGGGARRRHRRVAAGRHRGTAGPRPPWRGAPRRSGGHRRHGGPAAGGRAGGGRGAVPRRAALLARDAQARAVGKHDHPAQRREGEHRAGLPDAGRPA